MDATAADVHTPGTDWKAPKKAMTMKEIMALKTICVKSDDGQPATVLKVDADKKLVWGWASIIEVNGEPVVDHQGDMIDEETLVVAAHKFIADARKAKVMHDGDVIGEIVESLVFTKEIQKALGIDVGKVGWFICMKINNADVWKRVKDGELKAFSIGGVGERVEI